MKVSKDSVVVANDAQASAEVSGEAVILSFQDGVYYGLDPVGSRVWELLQEKRSVQELHDQLLREYNVEADLLEKDLFSLLGELVDRHLVKIQDAPAA